MVKRDVKLSVADWYEQLCPLFSTIFEYKFSAGKGKKIMFNHLFMIYMKVYTADTSMDVNLLSLFQTSFTPTNDLDPDDPVDRCINLLCELILANRVSGRYSLN